MRTLRFNIIVLVLCLGLSTVNAQKTEKTHSEKFTVNKDVAIDIDTRYTDIEIETWDRNEVVIEAYLQSEDGTTQKAIDDYLEKWKFEALGNKSSIKIVSKSLGLIDIHSINFDSPNYDILYAQNANNALENLRFVIPEMPEIPEILELSELSEMPEILELSELPEILELPSKFDFKAYKKDKSYLERWKKKNKDVIGKNAKIKVGRNSISINSGEDDYSYKWNITTEGQKHEAKELEERLKEIEKRRKARHIELGIKLKERQAEMKLRQAEIKIRNKERNEKRKIALIKRQEANLQRSKDLILKRTEIRDILKKRGKSNIKRVIKIKAPKDAKFNMNVKHGSMSFPKN